MKRIVGMLLAGLISFSFIFAQVQRAEADSREIQVYFEGERLQFEDTDPILIDERTMVPFRKIFETLGFEVEWVDGPIRKAIGKKKGLTIELTIDSKTAIVNGKSVELDVPAQLHTGRTLVPLRFVSENSGFHVYFADHTGTFIVGIGATEEAADPGIVKTPADPVSADNKVEPYVVKGRVLNSAGKPVAGAEVWADNTFLYNSNILGVTDEQGFYRLELPNAATSYRMGGKYETKFKGASYSFDLTPTVDRPFGAGDGAVRDFGFDTSAGAVVLYLGLDSSYPEDEDENAPWFEMKDVELTLKPVGKLLDGSTGSTIIDFPIRQDGDRLEHIPIGTYEIAAIWKPKGYKEVPLLVSPRNEEQFAKRVTADFQPPRWGGEGYYEINLDVKFP